MLTIGLIVAATALSSILGIKIAVRREREKEALKEATEEAARAKQRRGVYRFTVAWRTREKITQ